MSEEWEDSPLPNLLLQKYIHKLRASNRSVWPSTHTKCLYQFQPLLRTCWLTSRPVRRPPASKHVRKSSSQQTNRTYWHRKLSRRIPSLSLFSPSTKTPTDPTRGSLHGSSYDLFLLIFSFFFFIFFRFFARRIPRAKLLYSDSSDNTRCTYTLSTPPRRVAKIQTPLSLVPNASETSVTHYDFSYNR